MGQKLFGIYIIYINHGKEVYMANILPVTEVEGSMIRDIHYFTMRGRLRKRFRFRYCIFELRLVSLCVAAAFWLEKDELKYV